MTVMGIFVSVALICIILRVMLPVIYYNFQKKDYEEDKLKKYFIALENQRAAMMEARRLCEPYMKNFANFDLGLEILGEKDKECTLKK